MGHSYNYISLFMPFIDISMSFNNLFQGISPVYNRFYLASFNEFFEENQIFSFRDCCPPISFLLLIIEVHRI